MREKRCEFLLVRYVPDLVKGEFVNIGVLLREAEGDGRAKGPVFARFTGNWSRVRCMDPDADIGRLEATVAEIGRRLQSEREGAALLAMLEDTLSNELQLTRARGCLAENLPAQMDLLMRMHVESRKREAVSRSGGRQAIYGAMKREFDRAGVWSFMDKQIPVTRFLPGADTLRIDCGYRNGGMRMFHAVPLEDIAAAKVLAFTAPDLRLGVLDKLGMELELTAIGEPLTWKGAEGRVEKNDDQLALYESGKRIMEKAGIRFLTTVDLPRIAERAREELGL